MSFLMLQLFYGRIMVWRFFITHNFRQQSNTGERHVVEANGQNLVRYKSYFMLTNLKQ